MSILEWALAGESCNVGVYEPSWLGAGVWYPSPCLCVGCRPTPFGRWWFPALAVPDTFTLASPGALLVPLLTLLFLVAPSGCIVPYGERPRDSRGRSPPVPDRGNASGPPWRRGACIGDRDPEPLALPPPGF